mgnify:FL=1
MPDGEGSVSPKSRLLFLLITLLPVLAACGTTPAREYGGRWKPVNRFAEQPQEIPLHSAYVFQASPLDRTLKAMLSRWARDTGLQLQYRLQSDYTLHQQVAQVTSTEAVQAAQAVSQAYRQQGVQVRIQDGVLVAEPVQGDAG